MLADPSQVTVGDYLTNYLANATHISPKTLERYHELAARQIIPHIGSVKLQKLKPEHVEVWHKALLSNGNNGRHVTAKSLSTRTVSHAHRLLAGMLARALTNGTIARNVAAIAKPPRVEAKEIEILPPDKVPAVLEALTGSWVHPIAVLALASGMRRGELLALRWSDIDLDKSLVHVGRSVEETKAHGLRAKSPKTKAGRRNFKVDAEAVAVLRAHRAEQMRIRLELGQGGKPELVFGTIEDQFRSPDDLTSEWCRLRQVKKLPLVSFHSLRHTHVSILIRRGVDILTISRRIGHRKASITLDVYGHLIDGNDDAAAKAMEGVLK
jgi:integrase